MAVKYSDGPKSACGNIWRYMGDGKKKFFNLLHRAIKPVPKEGQTSTSQSFGNYGGKRTRSGKTGGTSVKLRGESQR